MVKTAVRLVSNFRGFKAKSSSRFLGSSAAVLHRAIELK